MLTFADKETLAQSLNRMPFVRWDRFAEDGSAEGPGDVSIYGWIDRDDGRSDFVLLECELRDDGWAIGYTTSSALYSEKIGELLYDVEQAHYPCQRVDVEFGDLVDHKVVLS